MTEARIRRMLRSMVLRAGVDRGFGIGVRRVDEIDPPPRVAELDRGFRVSERRRREFLAGRAAAAEALAHRGVPRCDVPRTARGVPVWPEGVVGSISHSREWAVAVVLDADAAVCCGVDIEESAGSETASSTELHCAREAAYKALSPGTGLSFRPEEWDLIEPGPGPDGRWTVAVPGRFTEHWSGTVVPRLVTAAADPLHAALALAPGPA